MLNRKENNKIKYELLKYQDIQPKDSHFTARLKQIRFDDSNENDHPNKSDQDSHSHNRIESKTEYAELKNSIEQIRQEITKFTQNNVKPLSCKNMNYKQPIAGNQNKSKPSQKTSINHIPTKDKQSKYASKANKTNVVESSHIGQKQNKKRMM
jgi:hypothetical protein